MHGILIVRNLNKLLSKANFQNNKGNINLHYIRIKAETQFGIEWLSWFSAYAKLTYWATFQPLWLLMRKGCFIYLFIYVFLQLQTSACISALCKRLPFNFYVFSCLGRMNTCSEEFLSWVFLRQSHVKLSPGEKNGFFYLTSTLIFFILTFGLEFSLELARVLALAVWHVKGEEMYKCPFLAKDNIAFWITWLTSGRQTAAAQSALPWESSWKQGRRRYWYRDKIV